MSGMTVNILGTGPKYHINLIVEHRYPRRVKTGSQSPVLSLPERQDGDRGMTTQHEAVQLDSVEMGSVGNISVRQPSQRPAPQLHSVEGTPSQDECVPSPLAGQGVCIPSVCSDLQSTLPSTSRQMLDSPG